MLRSASFRIGSMKLFWFGMDGMCEGLKNFNMVCLLGVGEPHVVISGTKPWRCPSSVPGRLWMRCK